MAYNGPPGHEHPKGWAAAFLIMAIVSLLIGFAILIGKVRQYSGPSEYEQLLTIRAEQRQADLEKTKAEAEYWREAAKKLNSPPTSEE